MLFRLFFLFFFSLSFSFPLSTYYQKEKQFLSVQFKDIDQSKLLLDELCLMNQKLPDSLISKNYNYLGTYYGMIGSFDESLKSFLKALDVNKNIATKNKANIYSNIANVYKFTKRFDLSLVYLKKAFDLYQSLEDESNVLKIESEICSLYYQKGDFNTALTKSLDLLDKFKNTDELKIFNIHQFRIANIYFSLGDFKRSLSFYNQSLNYFKNSKDGVQNYYISLMNIGDCYFELGSVRCLTYYNLSLKGFKKIKDVNNEHLVYSKLGGYYFNKQDLTHSKTYYDNSFDFFIQTQPFFTNQIIAFYLQLLYKKKDFKQLDLVIAAYQNSGANKLAIIEDKIAYNQFMCLYSKYKNDTAKELFYLRESMELRKENDSINNFENLQRKINKYDIKISQQKNNFLKLENTNLRLKNTVIFFFLAVFILVLLLFIEKNKRNTKIKNLEIDRINNEKEILEMETKVNQNALLHQQELSLIKEKELTTLQLKLFQIKNDLFVYLENSYSDKKALKETLKKVNSLFSNQDYWKEFEIKFTNIHPAFIEKLRLSYPQLTKKDIDFCILIKLNLSNKEISSLLKITYESVISKKYVLRKKMRIYSDNQMFEFFDTL
jgi:tetratricopeptide (TPR) repeat protein